MSTEDAHSRGSLFGNVLTGHTVDFATHTSTICIKYQVLLAAYYKAAKATHIYSFHLFPLSIFRHHHHHHHTRIGPVDPFRDN
jgi:hypothetical protein